MGFWASAAPALIQGGASMLSGALDIFGAKESAKAAKENNAMQLAWEREKFNKEIELANTAHQREMADYAAAGINPLLALNGHGSSVPTANAINPSMPDTSGYGKAGNALQMGVNSIISNIREQKIAEAGIKKAEADADLTKAQADAIRKDYGPGGIKEQDIKKRQEEIEYIKTQRNVSEAQAKKIMKEAEDIAARTAYQEIINKIKEKDLKMYWVDKVVNYVLQGLSIFGIGRILSGFAGKQGDKVIEQMTKNKVNEAFKEENMKEWMNEDKTLWQRYRTVNGGYIDTETGEFHPSKL